MKKSIFTILAVLTVFVTLVTGCPNDSDETTYTVTFNGNAADAAGVPAPITGVASGATITKPSTDPTRAGYTFDGWFKEQATSNAWNFSTETVTANITLWAKWTSISGGGGGIKFEAEDAAFIVKELSIPEWGISFTGPQVEDSATASGGKSVGWLSLAEGIELIWNLTSSSATTATLYFNLCSGTGNEEMTLAPATTTISVNGTNLDYPSKPLITSGADQTYNTRWREETISTINLIAGNNIIKIVTPTGAPSQPNVDYMRLETTATVTWSTGFGPGTNNNPGDGGTGPGDGNAYTGAMNFKVLIDPTEAGPGVGALVVTLPAGDAIDAADIAGSKFRVTGPNRTVTDAYISDDKGVKQTMGSSNHFTIKMEVTMGAWGVNNSAFTYNNATSRNTWATNLGNYTVSLASGQTLKIKGTDYTSFDFSSKTYNGRISPATDSLLKGQKGLLRWAAYETQEMKEDNGKNALIIWLHGAGEGGEDVDIALLGNQVTELFTDTIQKYFKVDGRQGAYVLVVQAPTYWMDNGNGQNHSGADISTYTAGLMETIKEYAETTNTDIDNKRIYLGGCSNGGYMTMNMIISYPDYFAAAYPVCQAYANSYLDDTKLNTIKNIPIWFTSAYNDGTVNPANFSNPTFVRLVRANAANVHYTLINQITSRDFPNFTYTQANHYSWIWTLQDRCVYDFGDATRASISSAADVAAAAALITTANCNAKPQISGQEVTLWGWLAKQAKP